MLREREGIGKAEERFVKVLSASCVLIGLVAFVGSPDYLVGGMALASALGAGALVVTRLSQSILPRIFALLMFVVAGALVPIVYPGRFDLVGVELIILALVLSIIFSLRMKRKVRLGDKP